MRAIITANPDQGLDGLAVTDIAEPAAPQGDQIKVRLLGSSLNYHDLGVAMGTLNKVQDRILLADGAGIVEAVGEDVTDFKPGDEVVSCFFPDWQAGGPTLGDFSRTPGDGLDGYARDLVVTPQSWFTKAPKGWTATESSTITTAGLTAWRALVTESNIKAGDKVLLLGTGGVSIYALQLAKGMGASVAITSSSNDKLAKAKALGADFTVNYKEDENWGETVANWAEGGVDIVVEVGGPATLTQSITACRVGGKIILIGVLTGMGGEIPTAYMMLKQIRLQGIVVGSRSEQQDMVKALEQLAIKPVIDKTFGFAELAEAFRYELAAGHFGKIAIDYTL
ncbi:zinc-dependent alcohol dehydrogenase family protein [Alteromonas lipolytica]|uniref:NADPH:quinone oxidoreductase n=1 Tax=Alteromonas lipolytica TaxID=1856405 RepID=A0A1E8F8R0_9ALTE|nr:NAD(P)-dependent alcohol dehydrogenase [Alteromonas lipolytica]OFI32302.1 NADPH:quinone oxidoreductase [Alteromonas lipolytica]GGF85663.1 alcohol dehydrogenase [Alteromonas lipolytica]